MAREARTNVSTMTPWTNGFSMNKSGYLNYVCVIHGTLDCMTGLCRCEVPSSMENGQEDESGEIDSSVIQETKLEQYSMKHMWSKIDEIILRSCNEPHRTKRDDLIYAC